MAHIGRPSNEIYAWEYRLSEDKSIQSWKESELQDFRSQIPSPLLTSNDLIWSKRRIIQQIIPTIRWCIFSVYRRLFTVVFLSNMVGMAVLLVMKYREADEEQDVKDHFVSKFALSAVAINIFTGVSFRNEHIINLLYSAFVLHASVKLPLWLRRRLAKVYCYGGVHSGCAVAAASWYSLFAVLQILKFLDSSPESRSTLEFGFQISTWAVVFTVITVAFPYLRYHYHNFFEIMHRFGGWCLIGLFWCQLIIGLIEGAEQSESSIGAELLRSVAFWALSLTTILIIYPWLWLRRVSIHIEPLSNHAVRAHFTKSGASKIGYMSGKVIRVSRNPLLESHSFATIPESTDLERFSVIVSRAGDFTKQLIDQPPTHVWIRNIYASGVILVARMFDPVVVVATGSGIGPCLGLFAGYPNLNCRILWSTHDPINTYGSTIVESVQRADPNAKIIDTAIQGRQDMLQLSYDMYLESGAETVVIISNRDLTKEVVFGLEVKQVPAFGPIWDS